MISRPLLRTGRSKRADVARIGATINPRRSAFARVFDEPIEFRYDNPGA